jgi:uncharacterized protein (TIGR02246 family)
MRIAALALTFAMIAAAPAIAGPPTEADAVALRALAADADEAWNAADAERMSGYYAGDATLQVTGRGEQFIGRDAIRAFMAQAFAARAGVFRHVTEVRRMDAVSPDLVFTDADVRVEQRQADGSWKLARTFGNVSIAAREGQGWRLRAVRAWPRT